MNVGPSAARIMRRCDELARISASAPGLTRVFLSPEHRRAAALVMQWMREAGMGARLDAMGNVLGRFEGTKEGAPCLMLGSHLDTVRDAGRYDGMLGVVVAIECVQALADRGRRLPFAVEVIGFGDEEGVRFGATLLGSRAVAGSFDTAMLNAKDHDGVTLGEALQRFGLDPAAIGAAARRREDLLAYVEVHIEQGPVLEAEDLPLGVVNAINGFSRLRITLKGFAGHAGTVPMKFRRDALAAAAECVLTVERIACTYPDLVGTVGRIEVEPGAINVIPGEARFTVDARSPYDPAREAAVAAMLAAFDGIASARGIEMRIEHLQQQAATSCAPALMAQLESAVTGEGLRAPRLPSGAGHDGMAMASLVGIAMLFVRCKAGISHHPAESITPADAGCAARVLLRFMENFRL